MIRIAVAVLSLASAATAQLPAIRSVRLDAATRDSFPALTDIRPLSDGRVMVNDPVARRVSTFDSKLRTAVVLFDSTTLRPLAYPRGLSRLVVARGDTTFLVDPETRGFRVIDPSGVVVRRQSIMNAADVYPMGGHFANTGLDPLGRVVFAELVRPTFRVGGPPQSVSGLNILRVGFDRISRDTLATIASPPGMVMMASSVSVEANRIRINASPVQRITPTLPIFDAGDDWALLSDGTVAIVRVADYHIDWIEMDGRRHSTPPVAWPWRVLSAADKERLVDSVRAQNDSQHVIRRDTAVTRPPPGFEIGPPVISPDLPDSVPPFVRLHGHADLNGRIWIREGPSIVGRPVGHPVYDIIDRTGRIVDRVQLPDGRGLAGFGPGGAIYAFAQAPTSVKIERYILGPR
jgi:hypothetical protein